MRLGADLSYSESGEREQVELEKVGFEILNHDREIFNNEIAIEWVNDWNMDKQAVVITIVMIAIIQNGIVKMIANEMTSIMTDIS